MANAVYTRATGDLVQQVLERPRALKKKAPHSDGSTTKLTLSVDREVVDWFKASGADWRARMQEALRNATDLGKAV
ncbi:BrnA antitoxin family protein [Ensifer sp. HO-A22]|uniref:BrnA antitoxin family protein n=1 Tax=Ensifer oleiphilus TaxID=2742698 RepID=A0A7Y6UQ53_9HYPH|nr:BrnA antitoxin family protein [Ensifer oleiphilus]